MFEKCYLDYVNLGVFEPSKFTNPQGVNDPTYRDPDGKSKELYDDLIELYQTKFNRIGYRLEYNNFDVLVKNEEYTFSVSSDFIGSSRAHAKSVGISDVDVGKYLKESRVLGGHVLFPKTLWINGTIEYTGKGGTINTARGGEKGFCDRFDCTLQDIKLFYSSQNSKLEKYYNKYNEWLYLFKSFKGFIDFFSLNDFCNPNYEVYDLSSVDDNMKYTRLIDTSYSDISFYKINDMEIYSNFIKGNENAIKLRNKRLQCEFDATNTNIDGSI